MKKFMAAMLAILLFALTGCGGGNAETVYPEVNTLEGVTLELEEDTLKNAEATFRFTNATEEDITYDPKEYHLEILEDGQWQETVGTRESQWEREESAVLKSGESIDLTINWKVLHGSLGKGTFRIIIIAQGQPIAAEFTKE